MQRAFATVLCAVIVLMSSAPTAAVAANAGARQTPTWAEVAKWPDFTRGVWAKIDNSSPGAAAIAGGGAPNPASGAAQAARTQIMSLLTPAAKAQYEALRRGPRKPNFGCDPFGFPAAFDGDWQFLYARDVILVLSLQDYITVVRRIYMDGRAHGEPEPTWMGHSVGRWEGDTLVVDTVGLSEEAQIMQGLHGTLASHAVERFRLAAPESLSWQLSYENPELLTKPYTASRTLKLQRGREIPEAYCTNDLDVEGLNVTPP